MHIAHAQSLVQKCTAKFLGSIFSNKVF